MKLGSVLCSALPNYLCTSALPPLHNAVAALGSFLILTPRHRHPTTRKLMLDTTFQRQPYCLYPQPLSDNSRGLGTCWYSRANHPATCNMRANLRPWLCFTWLCHHAPIRAPILLCNIKYTNRPRNSLILYSASCQLAAAAGPHILPAPFLSQEARR
jgi:hypothetical protein